VRFAGALWAGRVALLALSFGIGTWIVGWWAIPLLAAIAAVLARDVAHQAAASAVAAAAAWGALLAWSASQGSVWAFSRLAGGAMGVSGLAGGAMGVSGLLLILMTLAFPAALAWSAASVTRLLARGKPVTN
jgi:hypothetical protein